MWCQWFHLLVVLLMKFRCIPSIASLFTDLPLDLLINSLIKIRYFPRAWKHGRVLFIPKPGAEKYCLKSLRPITLLPFLSKVFERILINQLDYYLYTNNLMSNLQFGFTKQVSTMHPLHNLNNFIKTAKRRGRSVLFISLDISGAFDSVCWSTLVKRFLEKRVPEFLVRCFILFYIDANIRDIRESYWETSISFDLINNCSRLRQLDLHVCGPNAFANDNPRIDAPSLRSLNVLVNGREPFDRGFQLSVYSNIESFGLRMNDPNLRGFTKFVLQNPTSLRSLCVNFKWLLREFTQFANLQNFQNFQCEIPQIN